MFQVVVRALSVSLVILVAQTSRAQHQPQLAPSTGTPPPVHAAALGGIEPSPLNQSLVEPAAWNQQTTAPATGYRMSSPREVIDAEKKYPTVRLSGFFQADVGWAQQSPSNEAAVGDVQDGADFRRARLQAVGDVWENVGYSVEFDFASPGRPSFMDVWLELRDLYGDANLRIGQYRQPIGMDGLTSVKELTFIERALPFALLPFRQIGGMLHGTAADDAMTWAVSTYRFPTDFFGGNMGDNGGYGLATRLTALLFDQGDDLLVHVGGAYSFADPSNDALRYFAQPEFFLADTGAAVLVPERPPSIVPPFVDTGAIPSMNFNLFAAELAARYQQFHLESELLISVVDQLGGGTAVFPGAYVQAGYFLTGEVRPYNHAAGVLDGIEPEHPFGKNGCGAWELAGRWSMLDLSDSGIYGGILDDLTVGVNWYLNQYTKFQLNYIRAFLDSPLNGHSTADIVAMRAQLDF